MATEQQVQQRQQRKSATFRLEPGELKMLSDIAWTERTSMTAVVQLLIRQRYQQLRSRSADPVPTVPEAKEAQRKLGKPTDKQIKLLGTDKLRQLGYDI